MLFLIHRFKLISISIPISILALLLSCSTKKEHDGVVTLCLENKDYLDIVTVSGTLETVKTHNYVCPGVLHTT